MMDDGVMGGWWVNGPTHPEPLWTAINETEAVNAEPVAGVAGTIIIADFITFLENDRNGQRADCRLSHEPRATHEDQALIDTGRRNDPDRVARRVVRTLPRTRHVMQPCLVRLRFCLTSVAAMWAAARALAVFVALFGGAMAFCGLRCAWATMAGLGSVEGRSGVVG